MLNSCTLCPHNCKVNRLEGKKVDVSVIIH